MNDFLKEFWEFLNDIKKSLFLLKNGSSGIYHPKDNVISQYFSTIPSMACLIMLEKIKSFLNIVNNVESAVIISNKKE